MNKNQIVIGLGFGDEGKGIFTDYLCSKSPNALVVRFSGGHQVGHTVVKDNFRHVFSNFGSGTLRNVPTYWSPYCTVSPNGIIREYEILKENGFIPFLYIDENCPITTPYDINYNRLLDEKKNYGSVGVGFGATVEREEKLYSLKFKDLFYSKIFKAKCNSIANYYAEKLFKEELQEFFDSEKLKEHLEQFYYCCEQLKDLVDNDVIIVVDQIPKGHGYRLIYEGSQGLLLDQNYGIYPNVTWSNIGTKNILHNLKKELITNPEYNLLECEYYLITRAYQTRHGNGFMTNEDIPHNIEINPLETNQNNKYQGKLRRSLLDVSLLEYAINSDKYIQATCYKNLVITCLDHVQNELRFTYKDQIISSTTEKEFVSKIARILGINSVYLSRNSDSKYIEKF